MLTLKLVIITVSSIFGWWLGHRLFIRIHFRKEYCAMKKAIEDYIKRNHLNPKDVTYAIKIDDWYYHSKTGSTKS